MKYFDLYSSYPDRNIAAAWDSQVKGVDKTPWLADTLAECESDLYARFAACYAELRALPRSARRALQRRIGRSSQLAAIVPISLQQGGRRLQYGMASSLAGAALLLALGQGVAKAAAITVTTTTPGINAADGQCSLIEAIVNANNNSATHGNCPAGSGADTIVLPANAHVMLSAAYASLYGHPVGLPLITSPITIQGNGAMIARQGSAPAFALMAVSNSGDLTLQSVTLSGGSSFWGTGVYNSFGTLTIENSTISGNTDGGGVRTWGGTTTIINSTISGNTGGGLYNVGTLTIENSTISGNTANVGGGVFNYGGSLTITNSTISGNRADQGGGVFNSAYYAFIPGCCPGTLTLNRSLIAGNQAAVGPEIENATTMPLNTVTANNSNLFGADGNAGVSGFSPGPTDIVPAPGVSLTQILGPLRNNGGPTRTLALKPGSPALDVVPLLDPSCTGTDQRGITRPQGTACDVGAIEGFAPGSIPVSDFDGDGETDVAVYRSGAWFVLRSLDGGVMATGWGGLAQDIPVPADYDGDGKTDIAVYRDGAWFISRSSDRGVTALGWGGSPQDIPLPADYDGDGKADIAVYRSGAWFILRSSDGGVTALGWGGSPQDIPLPADYDGDGKADIAVYRSGAWFILRSSDGGVTALGWGGLPQDIPLPADYDGDGKADIAVYRSGAWFILRSSDGGVTALGWGGLVQDVPVPADYDGDGKTDIAVFRDGEWFIFKSSGGTQAVGWGAAGDIPLN